MSRVLYIDTEVKAPYKGALTELGLDAYSRHPNTRVLLLPWAVDDEPERLEDLHDGSPISEEFDEAWRTAKLIVAHNAMFDRVVLMNARSHMTDIKRWDCTAARARIHGLPGSLDTLSRIFDLDTTEAKKDGKALIDLFCERGASPEDHPLEWASFCDYAVRDITALRKLHKILPTWCWTERERALYHLDQEINDRGFARDEKLANELIAMAQLGQADLDAQVQKISNGAIERGTQRDRVKDFIGTVPDMRAETLRRALRDDKEKFTPEQIKMIQLRLLSSKSSIAKCATALRQSSGGRIRYSMTYAGGGRIGRWSHKGFQPGNMPRPTMEPEEIEAAIDVVNAVGGAGAYSIFGDQSLEVGANAIRGLIVAAPGKKLVAADWSNIEGRMLAWYAGEGWKLDAYRAGQDMYRLVGARMTGRDADSFSKKERQGFKGCELSMGYEGGVGAYVNVANAYQVDLVALAAEAPAVLGREYMERGRGSWAWAVGQKETNGLARNVYVACAAYKFAWRDACPETVQLWRELLNQAKAAIRAPGRQFTAAGGKVTFLSTGGWLAVKLSSGRAVMFAKPKISMERQFRYDEAGNVVQELEPREVVTALKSPTWRREHVYGGLLANAVTQGGCRDILGDGLLRSAEAEWPVVLHVHDEIVAELEAEDPRDHRDLEKLMCKLPAWCAGMPIAAEGFTGFRYRK